MVKTKSRVSGDSSQGARALHLSSSPLLETVSRQIHIAKINGITRKLLDKQKIDAPENLYSFDKTANVFKRSYKYSVKVKDAFTKLKSKDKDIFKSASYTSIFRFQNSIASSSNKISKISPSGKAIMLNTPAMELIYGTINISNNIQLSR